MIGKIVEERYKGAKKKWRVKELGRFGGRDR